MVRAASGYGRELFFSNIIHFIATKHPCIIKESLSKYLPQGFGTVTREAKHTDLTFYDENDPKKPVLIIENKRGAIATEKQLKTYKDKLGDKKDNCKFLLISPHFFVEEVAQKAEWAFMDYEALALAFSDSIEKHSGELTPFEYSMLKATAAYMQSWKIDSDDIYRGITENSICKELVENNKGLWDTAKLKYFAVYQFLSKRKENDPELGNYTCLFDSGTTNPMVQFNLSEDIRLKGLKFQIFLQNGRIELGFGKKNYSDITEKKDRKNFRAKLCKKNKLTRVISDVTKGLEFNIPPKNNSRGYMSKGYVLCMFKESIIDKKISQALDLICEIAKRMEKYIAQNN